MPTNQKTFKKRKQPINRRKYGKMESKADVLRRIKEEKEYQAKVRYLEDKISKKNSQEFSFKMYSTYLKNGKLFSKNKISMEERENKLNYLHNEIKRVEKILKNNLKNKKCTKIDLLTGKKTDMFLDDIELSEDYELYYEKLHQMKNKIKN